jgi:hypothetical protein
VKENRFICSECEEGLTKTVIISTTEPYGTAGEKTDGDEMILLGPYSSLTDLCGVIGTSSK